MFYVFATHSWSRFSRGLNLGPKNRSGELKFWSYGLKMHFLRVSAHPEQLPRPNSISKICNNYPIKLISGPISDRTTKLSRDELFPVACTTFTAPKIWLSCLMAANRACFTFLQHIYATHLVAGQIWGLKSLWRAQISELRPKNAFSPRFISSSTITAP